MQGRRVDPAGAVFGVVVPVLAAGLTLAVTALWEDRLPAEIATHWSDGSGPDGFSSPWSNAGTVAALIVVIGGGTGAVSAAARAQLMLRRVMLAVSSVVTGLIATVDIVLLAGQRDLQDASAARLHTWSIGVGVLLGLVVGVAGAALLRDHRVRVPASAPPPAGLPRPDRLVLPVTDTVGAGGRVTVAVYGFLLVVAVAACIPARSPWPIPLFAACALLAAAVLRFRVVLDGQGLRVLCLGAPVIGYEAEELAEADVRTVEPFAEFGGWGLRARGRGRYGVVTRRGPGFTVRTGCGHRLTVTTDKAHEFASAVNSLADGRFLADGRRAQ